MKKSDVQNVLVVGVDGVALAASAKKAGYKLFAADYFGDQDLRRICDSNLSILKQEVGKSCGRLEKEFSPPAILNLVKKLAATRRIDGALLASGLEDSPTILEELNELTPIFGNHPATIEKVRNKREFLRELKAISVSHARTLVAESVEEGKQAAKDIGYPVVLKPMRGFGGMHIRKARDERELVWASQELFSSSKEILVQELLPGREVSVSFLSSKVTAVPLTFNEQLTGIRELGQRELFGYSGSVVPASISSSIVEECTGVVQKVASRFGLLGSNGLDLVISRDQVPYVVEVNPRFQGTLECVERFTGLNLVKAHMRALREEELPLRSRIERLSFCVRLVLFAHCRSVAPKLDHVKEARDIPLPGAIIEEGEPLCSIVVEGKTRRSAIAESKMVAEQIYELTKPSLQ